MLTTEQIDLAKRISEFWMNVYRTVDQNECWPWLGYQEDGYGRFFFDGKMTGAHELALTFTTGEQRLARLDTCHSCNNPICCNPRHLRFDTRASNVADMIAAGRNYRPTAKLNDEIVEMIRERYQAGASQQVLGEQYGVTNGLISLIVRGLRWPKAPGPISSTRERYNHGR